MLEKKTYILSLILLIAIMPVLAESQAPGNNDGETCTDNSECDSNACRDDYNTSNGAYCAKDENTCVHLIDGDTEATQYNDNDLSEQYICDNSNWKKKDGESCVSDSDCDSGRCRSDYNSTNGDFCAKDENTCVHLIDGDTEATQYNDNDLSGQYICDNSYWKTQNGESCVSDSDCDSGRCRSDYNSTNGDFCAKDGNTCVHLIDGDTSATQYNDNDLSGQYICDNSNWKKQNGESCSAGSDCNSGYCRPDYDSSNGDYCAKDSSSCVHLQTGDIKATQYNNKDKSESYRCNNGFWKMSDNDNDGVGDNNDLCPGTTADCTVSNNLIDPNNGCPFKPFSFHTSLEEYDNETCVVGSFGVYAEPLCGADPDTEITYRLGGSDKSTCDTHGDELWPWPEDDSKYMCPVENLTTPGTGTFNLLAVYNYPKLSESLITKIKITNDCNPTVECLHALSITDDADSLVASLDFSSSYYVDGSDYVCCKGTSVGISDINMMTSVCSNGVPLPDVPGVVGWIYQDGDYQWLSINNAFSTFFDRCVARTTRRENVIGPTSLNVGYIPVSDCIDPSLSGDTMSLFSTNKYILSQTGKYKIVTDIVQTACDSPSAYICPWESPSRQSDLCDVGILDTWQESNGWMSYKTFNINVINPAISFGSFPSEMTYYVSDPYNPEYRYSFTWDIENNGIGDLKIDDIIIECPSEMSCESAASEIVIPEGTTGTIQATFTLPCEYSESVYPLKISFDQDDAYGLGCMSSSSEFTTDIIQGSSSDSSEAACECYTGQAGLWDDINGCCDSGDCWSSEGSPNLCDNGMMISNAEFCDRYSSCLGDMYWNGTSWHDSIPPGCGCTTSDECGNGNCVDGICMYLTNPDISFSSGDDITARLGETVVSVITIRNNLPVKDTISLSVDSEPPKLAYWTKFTNDKNSIDVTLDANGEKSIPLSIFCGEKGSYNLLLSVKSILSPSLNNDVSLRINIVGEDVGLSSKSPDIGTMALVLIVIISIIFIYKKKRFRKRRK